MSEHTKGKWIYAKPAKKIIASNGDENDFAFIALIPSSNERNIPEDEQDANGFLIAAAPDLLSIAESVLSALQHDNASSGCFVYEIESLQKAIDKAKGQ